MFVFYDYARSVGVCVRICVYLFMYAEPNPHGPSVQSTVCVCVLCMLLLQRESRQGDEPYIHTYIHTYMHACMHTYIVTATTYIPMVCTYIHCGSNARQHREIKVSGMWWESDSARDSFQVCMYIHTYVCIKQEKWFGRRELSGM